jgi:hypothetical protein
MRRGQNTHREAIVGSNWKLITQSVFERLSVDTYVRSDWLVRLDWWVLRALEEAGIPTYMGNALMFCLAVVLHAMHSASS